jgi:hypothetical protein
MTREMSIGIGSEGRRELAAQLANTWTRVSWRYWEQTGLLTPVLDANGIPIEGQNCEDCTRFVSFILWSVGFEMVGNSVYDADLEVSLYQDGLQGWWANTHESNRLESSAWANANAFYDWWLSYGGAIEASVFLFLAS